MAARSTVVELLNGTGYQLGLVQASAEGAWNGPPPPQTIEPGAFVRWTSESNETFTGTEGRAEYAVGGSGASIHLHWDNPFAGGNSYDEQAPPGLRLQRSGGGGDDAAILWRLDQTAGFWGQLATRPGPSVVLGPAWLLTDGRVMAKQVNSAACWALTPDAHGSYAGGTWRQVSAMQGDRKWFSSAVLSDGRLLVSGGEFFNGAQVWSNLSEVYDPVADGWLGVSPPVSLATATAAATPWPQIGDASSAVLADGRVLIGNINTPEVAFFNAKTQAFTVSPNSKASRCDEESWTLMPDGTIVTIETNNPPNAEKYLPAFDRWVNAGTTGASVLAAGGEIGPALALPNGDGMTAGGNGTIIRYTPDPADLAKQGRWSSGPTFPNDVNGLPFQPKDTPACLLPDGRVLIAVSPNDQGSATTFPAGLFFFLYDPAAPVSVSLQPVDATAVRTVGKADQAAMLLLPTGQVLLTLADGDGRNFVYNPLGQAAPGWRPVIEPVPYSAHAGATLRIYGRRFNGISQGSAYGDDVAVATNYPVARLGLREGTVRWARTHDHSTMGIATGEQLVWTDIDLPDDIAEGIVDLEIIVNGIASEPVALTILERSAPVVYTVEKIVESLVPIDGRAGPPTGGHLLWYRHDGWNDGTFKWHGPSIVGNGWAAFETAFSGGDGIVYAVTALEPQTVPVRGRAQPPAGADLVWYRHVGQENGTFDWQGPNTVGKHWAEFVHVFSGGRGIIYGIRPNGDLIWYRHLGRQDGSFDWQGPTKVGHGWADFKQVFSGGDGVIYAIENYTEESVPIDGKTTPRGHGRLLWYRHNGWVNGTDDWEARIVVGTDWADFRQAFAGSDGDVYAIENLRDSVVPIDGHATAPSGGHLLWYHHLGREDGTFRWNGPQIVGHGWSDFKYAFAQ